MPAAVRANGCGRAATQWRDHEHGQGTHPDDVGHHTGTYDMANDKRHRPRTSGTHGFDSRGYWLAHWPRWHDIVFHSRPRRRAEQAAKVSILHGVDHDE